MIKIEIKSIENYLYVVCNFIAETRIKEFKGNFYKMGIICEYYAIENSVFNSFINKPIEFEEYLYEKYGNPDGIYHLEGETFFYLDKAWDIAVFLLKQNDTTNKKILSKLYGKPINKEMEGYSFINSEDVKLICEVITNLTEYQIENAYDEEKMIKDEIYKSGWLNKKNNWDYILNHVRTIQRAFTVASEKNNMLIISKS